MLRSLRLMDFRCFAALDIDQLLAISKSSYRGITDEQIAAKLVREETLEM